MNTHKMNQGNDAPDGWIVVGVHDVDNELLWYAYNSRGEETPKYSKYKSLITYLQINYG